MEHHYTLAELKAMKTLGVGQVDNLKYDDGRTRVWLSRCGVEDGEPYPNKVTIEKYNPSSGCWEEAEIYQAR